MEVQEGEHGLVGHRNGVLPSETTAALTGRLPSLRTLEVGLRADEPQHLPPLITTAFHGALGHALRAHGDGSAYRDLLAVEGGEALGLGVTDRAPPALVMAPLREPGLDEPARMETDQVAYVRLVLIGERAIAHEATLIAAVDRALEGGLGISPDERSTTRPRMSVSRLRRISSGPFEPTGRELIMRMVSPLRLKGDGKIASRIEPGLLLCALVRRAQMLANAYGSGLPAWGLSDLPSEPSFQISEVNLSVRRARRYSSRQRQRMIWPGLVGELRLTGDLSGVGPLLRFAEAVQLGKGTSFGFGRFSLTSVEGDRSRSW